MTNGDIAAGACREAGKWREKTLRPNEECAPVRSAEEAALFAELERGRCVVCGAAAEHRVKVRLHKVAGEKREWLIKTTTYYNNAVVRAGLCGEHYYKAVLQDWIFAGIILLTIPSVIAVLYFNWESGGDNEQLLLVGVLGGGIGFLILFGALASWFRGHFPGTSCVWHHGPLARLAVIGWKKGTAPLDVDSKV